jgi:hypothetical protein
LYVQPGVPDKHSWRLSSSGLYSAKSAYMGLLQGAIAFDPWERIWKTWAPNKCRFFLWLVAHNRCWTADRLERRNLPHPDKCPFIRPGGRGHSAFAGQMCICTPVLVCLAAAVQAPIHLRKGSTPC